MSKLEHQDEFGAWIELPPGTEFVKIEEIPELIANALWPNIEPMIGGVYDEEADMDATFSRLSAKELVKQELRADASNPSFEVLDPITRGPHRFRVGRAFEGGLVTVATLTEYVRPRRIGVRLIPTFVTEAWPKSVPSNLAELPDDAKVDYVCRVGTQCGSGTCTAGEYRKQVEATIARQGEGHFTLDEAAQVLADSRPGLDPKETVKRFRLAHSKGALRIHQGGSRFPLEVGETVRDFWDTVEVSELDAWLRDSVSYGFPRVEGTSMPAPTVRASVTQGPAPDRGRRVKRAALIADNVRRWPTIERDLKDAATNGLSEAAKDGAAVGWWWEGSAVEWARARAKVQDVAPGLAGMTGTIHRMRG